MQINMKFLWHYEDDCLDSLHQDGWVILAGKGDRRELAAKSKQRCGTGGTVKDGRIEIQGDQRERIVAELEKLGFKVKKVGG